MKIVWLMLTVTSFVQPSHDDSSRTIFIPFQSGEACEQARTGAKTDPNKNWGIEADSAVCVTFKGDSDFLVLWPQGGSYDEAKKRDDEHLKKAIADAEQWKREYAAGLHRECDKLTSVECMKLHEQ